MNNLTYFIPIDFSASSYHAVEYAMMMTRLSGGQITLFHSVNLHDIDESDNPVVVNRSINIMMKQAETRLKSLQEMIQETRIRSTYRVELNYGVDETLQYIKEVKADFVVIGKEEEDHDIIRQTIRRLHLPVFIVPESAPLQLPSSFVLTTDLKHVAVDGFMHFLELVKSSTQPLHILHIHQKTSNGKADILEEWAEELKGFMDVDTRLLYTHHANITEGILDYCRNHSVDLLCAISRKKMPVFSPSISQAIARASPVPVLLLSSRSSFR